MSPPPLPPKSPPISATEVATNDDLLTIILIKLPIKPLLRCKSVNKQFNTLISDQRFSLLHTLRHPHPPPSALYFRHHNNLSIPSFSLLSLSPPSPPPSLPPSLPNILQSSHGLLLSSSNNQIYVSNPTTHRTAAGITFPDGCTGVSLAFDPIRWGQSYHLIFVYRKLDDYPPKFAIGAYSSTRHQLATTVDFFDAPFDTEFDRGVYWGGRVFWLSHTEKMVYYDVEGEFIGNVTLPRVFNEGMVYMERFRYFGESCGRLHLIEIRTNSVREFEVLEVEESDDGGVLEWKVKYKVDLDVVGCGFERVMFQDNVDRFRRELRFYAFSILAVVPGCGGEEGGGEEDVLVLSIPGKVISYDFKRKVSRLLSNVVDECDKWLPFRGFNAFPFIGSLCCV